MWLALVGGDGFTAFPGAMRRSRKSGAEGKRVEIVEASSRAAFQSRAQNALASCREGAAIADVLDPVLCDKRPRANC